MTAKERTAWQIADDLVRDLGRHNSGSASWEIAREKIRQELEAYAAAERVPQPQTRILNSSDTEKS